MIQAIQKYAALKGAVDRCDRVVVDTLQLGEINEAGIALESFNNGGKRLRPALLILSARACDGGGLTDPEPGLVDLAAAVELVHLATLFHDDVIDEVDTRRTKLSARLKYGNYASVLTGDYALAEALNLVRASGHPEAMPEFIDTLRVLVRGESIEVKHKYNYELSEPEYYEIIAGKSASLFELSCKAGALGTRHNTRMARFGHELGMAFQMIDDLDDLLDHPNHAYDCDLRNGYLALPIIGVLGAPSNGHRDELIGIIERGEFTARDEQYIVSLCLEYGTIQKTNDRIREHLREARVALDGVGGNEATELLGMVIDDLTGYADNQVGNFTRFLARRAS